MNWRERLINLGCVMALATVGAIVGDQVFQRKFSWPETKKVKGGGA